MLLLIKQRADSFESAPSIFFKVFSVCLLLSRAAGFLKPDKDTRYVTENLLLAQNTETLREEKVIGMIGRVGRSPCVQLRGLLHTQRIKLSEAEAQTPQNAREVIEIRAAIDDTKAKLAQLGCQQG